MAGDRSPPSPWIPLVATRQLGVATAKETVLGLAESIGLRPVDAGPLAWSRYLEGMALLNMGFNVFQGGTWTSAWRLAA
jgi:predicted dinucleotide-binding enzyme